MKKILSILLSLTMLFGIAAGTEAVASSKKKSKARTSAYAPKKYYSVSKYRGNIGPYDITMTLYLTDISRSDDFADMYVYKGSYTYTKAGNTMRLDGLKHGYNLWMLDEYTPSGRNSGNFDLAEDDYGNLYGTFTNTSTGEEFVVFLTKIR